MNFISFFCLIYIYIYIYIYLYIYGNIRLEMFGTENYLQRLDSK